MYKEKGTIIIDGSTSAVETNYDVTYTPGEDGYIWIAVHTSYNYLTVSTLIDVNDDDEDEIEKKSLKIQVFGDSMTDVRWNASKGVGTTRWVDYLPQYLPGYDLSIINSAIGGNTMTKYGVDLFKGVAWQMTLTETTAGVGNSDGYDQFEPLATDRDLIIVWAGCNDWAGAKYSWDDNSIIKYNASTFNAETGMEEVVEDSVDITKIHGAVRYVIDTVSKRTTARLLFITPVQRYTPPEWDTKNQMWKGDAVQPKNALGDVLRYERTLIQYVDAIKETCAFYGIPCIDMYSESGLNRFNINEFTIDGVHGNLAGHERFAAMIAAKIKAIL